MTVNIDGKEHEVRFGLKFVAELDKKYDKSGQAGYATGISRAVPMLFIGDMQTLSDVLFLSFCTEKNPPSKNDVDNYVETVEDIDALLEGVLEELKKQNATKIAYRKIEELFMTVQKAQKKELTNE